MNPQTKKLIAFVAAAVGIGVVFKLVLVSLATVSAGPEAELLTLLKAAEKELPAIALEGGRTLQPHAMQFQRLNVVVDKGTDKGVAAGTLDFNGQIGDCVVSSLGWEKVDFRHEHGDWTPVAGWAPRLVSALEALERRRLAIEQGREAPFKAGSAPADAGAETVAVSAETWAVLRNRRYRVEGWYLRSERDKIVVTEEWHLSGDTPDRPIDEKGRKSLSLATSDGGFFFETDTL